MFCPECGGEVHEYRPYEPPKQMTIEDAEADMRSNVLP